MKFTMTPGINTNGDIIPLEKRGKIISTASPAEAAARYELTLKSPRNMGKRIKTAPEKA